jgi:hypothetical protein
MGQIGSSTARATDLRSGLIWICSALSGACGNADRHDASKPEPQPIAGCETIDVAPCDTHELGCLQSRLELAACLRDTSPGRLPAISVMTEQEYADYSNSLYDGAPLRPNHFEVAMTWLGLAQPGSFAYTPLSGEDLTDWFGTYRWRQQDLLLIEHGKPADDAAANVELVAALILALRDRDTNLARWPTVVSITDIDSNWGGDAMYFGEAHFYSNRYKAALEGRPSVDADELTRINASIREDIAWIRAQPSSYVATLDRFPENFGARLACLAWNRSGAEGVNGLYESKFLTHQLMAAESEQGEAPPVTLHTQPIAPDGWVSDPSITAIGAWGLFLSLSRTTSTDEAWPLALGWRGDQIYVFKGAAPSEDTALVWQLEMDSEESAAALETKLAAGTPDAEIQRAGTFLTLAITTANSALDWAFVSD